MYKTTYSEEGKAERESELDEMRERMKKRFKNRKTSKDYKRIKKLHIKDNLTFEQIAVILKRTLPWVRDIYYREKEYDKPRKNKRKTAEGRLHSDN